MYIREFKNDIFVPLIISVGMNYDYLTSNFINFEKGYEGDWGDPEKSYGYAAMVNYVRDKRDGRDKVLLRFDVKDSMTIRIITHECFHVAMTICSIHNMSIGFHVGEDEHAAHIAGWAAVCCMDLLNEIKEKGEGEDGEKEISGGAGEETH